MGLVIDYSFDSTVTSLPTTLKNEYEGAVAAAVQYYEHTFNNNITVKILFSWGTEDGNAITGNTVGQNNATGPTENYTTIDNALADRVFGLALNGDNYGDSLTATNSLPASDPVGSGTYFVSNAQAKALGIATSYTTANHYDGFIGLNSSDSYTFDPSNRAVSGKEDAIGTLEHEIAEVLGRFDPMGQTGVKVDGNREQQWFGEYSALDLFHYNSTGTRSMTLGGTNPVSTAAYFSLDGSHYLEEYNNLSVSSGDLGDWLPSIKGDSYGDLWSGFESAPTPTDVREMNVIGWNRAPATLDDFTGTAVSDVLLYDQSTGDVGYDLMNGSLQSFKDISPAPSGYTAVAVGDFNNDGTDDILFFDKTTGDLSFFAMSNGGEPAGTGATEGNNAAGKSTGLVDIGPIKPGYSVVGTGLFEVGNGGNNTSDILLRNNSSGDFGFYDIVGGSNDGFVDLGSSPVGDSVVGVGDFENDGTSDVLFRNNTTGDLGFYNIVDAVNKGWVDLGSTSLAYSVVGVGDFFGSGASVEDVVLRDNATGDFGYYDIFDGINFGWVDLGKSSTAYMIVGLGDYYGNGTNDILFRDNANGDTGFYAIDSGSNAGWHDLGVTKPAYTAVEDGANVTIPPPKNDFNGDGDSDLLLQNTDGLSAIWLMNGMNIASAATITTPAGWKVEATGDFNQDNKADVVLQKSDGLPQIWLMNGTSVTSTVTLPNPGASWHVIATGDFNGDTNSDILWQNTDGLPAIWEMNGTALMSAAVLPNPGASWHAIGTGYFNADGNSYILWQNNDGLPAIWEMNGTSIMSAAVLPNPGASWHAIGTSDFNGDGMADIVFQNTDGLPAIWEMNGTSILNAAVLPNPGSTWKIKDDGPIPPGQMASSATTPQPALYVSSPDVANAALPASTPDRHPLFSGS